MSGNVAEFQLSLSRFTDEVVPNDIRELRNEIARTAHRAVVESTPYLTGRARGNVHLSMGEQPTSRFEPGARDPSGEGVLAAGEAALAASEDPYESAWISGDDFVFRFLNNGTKKMAGRHMIEFAISVAQERFG